ncbi:hypothetical protein RRG08_054643 [Elysia crispata]|uniref:Uncharacterized protein n=1 Tax=Elysia crispata TaxID=231223 RepID=A0AAE1B120_9GAST|nr:hypothetical protein RRG08_054643 [Elysia crispata]
MILTILAHPNRCLKYTMNQYFAILASRDIPDLKRACVTRALKTRLVCSVSCLIHFVSTLVMTLCLTDFCGMNRLKTCYGFRTQRLVISENIKIQNPV